MKLIPILVLMILASCEPVVRSSRSNNIPISQPLETQKPEVLDEMRFTSVTNIHISPTVKIDTDRQEIEIQSLTQRGCDVNLERDEILRYQFLSDNEIDVVIKNEVLRFKRIHKVKEEAGIYGDWQYVDYIEEQAHNRERIITLLIRDSDVMNADIYCEYGKYEV